MRAARRRLRRTPFLALLVVSAIVLTSCYGSVGMTTKDWTYSWDNSVHDRKSPVDWPVTIIFWGNADIGKVKNILNSMGRSDSGSDQSMYLKDYPAAAYWADDGGKKDPGTFFCTDLMRFANTSTHTRLYADGDGRMYNAEFGKYVIATTHKDNREHCTGDSYGWSESAADDVFAAQFASWGYQVDYDYWPMNNWVDNWRDGTHYEKSDGKATLIYIP